jgi:hypothetical protein
MDSTANAITSPQEVFNKQNRKYSMLKPSKDISLPQMNTELEVYRSRMNVEEYKKLKKIIYQQAEL